MISRYSCSIVILVAVFPFHGLQSFEFDAMPTCKVDNMGKRHQPRIKRIVLLSFLKYYLDLISPNLLYFVGMPLQNVSRRTMSKDYFDKTIRLPCSLQWTKTEAPMSSVLDMATVIHSKNTEDYDHYISTDWIPENKDKYGGRFSKWGGKSFDFDSFPPRSIMASQCKLDATEGTWDITRLGPFRTTGGYDWLQIGWDDIWGISKILKQHLDGIYIVEQYMSAVQSDGTRLNNPPIHIHHMHIGPAPYVRQRFAPLNCAFYNKGLTKYI